MKERRPLKMKNIIIPAAKSLSAVEIQQGLRLAATTFINDAITMGKIFIRTESQNNKIRCFFAEERTEFSVRFV